MRRQLGIFCCLQLLACNVALTDANWDAVGGTTGGSTIPPPSNCVTGTLSLPGPPNNLVTPPNVVDLELVDINHDTQPDIIIGNFQDSNLTIYLGSRSGTFLPPIYYKLQGQTLGIYVGDVTNDNNLDVLASTNQSNILFLKGVGDGTFAAPVVVPTTTTNSRRICGGDLNNDGKQDLIVATYANSIQTLIGKGDGTFTPTYNANFTLLGHCDTGYLNADNFLDVAVADYSTAGVCTLIGNGNGTLQSPNCYTSILNGATTPKIYDFNGDSINDVILVGSGFLALPGTGTGALGLNTFTYPLALDSERPSLVDLDRDGKMDVIVGNFVSGGFTWIAGGNGGTFRAPVTWGAGTQISSSRVADINGDGKLDIVGVANRGGSIAVALNNGTASSPNYPLYPTVIAGGTYVATGDIDVDGKPDFVSVGGTGTVIIGYGGGDGTFTSATLTVSGGNVNSVRIADVTGDGNQDIVAAVANANTLNVFVGDGHRNFGSIQTITTPAGYDLVLGDLNGDGFPDLVSASYANGTLGVTLSTGRGTFAPVTIYSGMGAPVGLFIADFNADGFLDVAVANSASNTVLININNGNGTLATPSITTGPGTPYFISAGNLNGDAYPDLTVANPNAHSVSVFLSSGQDTFLSPVSYTVVGLPKTMVLSDVNKDGNLDLVVGSGAYPGGGVSILLGVGNGTFQNPVRYEAGDVRSIAMADFNGDGRTDFAVANNNDGLVGIMLSSLCK